MSKLDGLLPRLKGEMLEICIGDEYEELVLFDNVRKVNTVIYGTFEEVVDDFVIINSFFTDVDGEFKQGNILYINTWHIKAFTKLKSNGSLGEAFMSSDHSNKVKRLIGFNE